MIVRDATSNDYLKSQGLYALRDGWIALHHASVVLRFSLNQAGDWRE